MDHIRSYFFIIFTVIFDNLQRTNIVLTSPQVFVYHSTINIRRTDDIFYHHDNVIQWKHFRGTGPLCGEFTGPGEFPAQRPVTRSFDVFFDLRLHKRLSKQPWGWWFETLSWSLWRHCNDYQEYCWSKSTNNSLMNWFWNCYTLSHCLWPKNEQLTYTLPYV